MDVWSLLEWLLTWRFACLVVCSLVPCPGSGIPAVVSSPCVPALAVGGSGSFSRIALAVVWSPRSPGWVRVPLSLPCAVLACTVLRGSAASLCGPPQCGPLSVNDTK